MQLNEHGCMDTTKLIFAKDIEEIKDKSFDRTVCMPNKEDSSNLAKLMAGVNNRKNDREANGMDMAHEY
jgi:hypothetical protein